MVEPVFKHYDLELKEPPFGSSLTDLIIDLNHLRKKHLGEKPFQKQLFPVRFKWNAFFFGDRLKPIFQGLFVDHVVTLSK